MRVPNFPTVCPDCKELAIWEEEYETPGPFNDLCRDEPVFLGWVCEECGWTHEADEAELAAEYELEPGFKAEYDRIQNVIWESSRKTYDVKHDLPLDVFFNDAPEGDFEWVDDEGGDWLVYDCGESDCPVGWHRTSPWTSIGRKDGKRFIETGSTDDDGDSQPNDRWEDGDDWESSGVAWDLVRHSDEYFRGWADYWLHCASTGDDPIDNYTGKDLTPIDWAKFCLSAAWENASWLQKQKK